MNDVEKTRPRRRDAERTGQQVRDQEAALIVGDRRPGGAMSLPDTVTRAICNRTTGIRGDDRAGDRSLAGLRGSGGIARRLAGAGLSEPQNPGPQSARIDADQIDRFIGDPSLSPVSGR